MSDVDAALEPERLGAVEDQVELERAEIAPVVEVDVDPRAMLGGDRHDRVKLADRVAVDACGVEAADVLDAVGGGAGEQIDHARPAQHAVLRERDDLARHGLAVVGERFAHHLDAAQPDAGVDIDVRADARRAVPHEFCEHPAGDVYAGDAEFVAPRALVPDAALGAALAPVRLPRPAPPRLVDVRVGVDESGDREQSAPVDLGIADGLADGRAERGDRAVLVDEDVLQTGVGVEPDATQGGDARGEEHASILPSADSNSLHDRDNLTEVHGPMAQLVARLVRIEEVRGSNPLRSTGIQKTPAQAGVFCVWCDVVRPPRGRTRYPQRPSRWASPGVENRRNPGHLSAVGSSGRHCLLHRRRGGGRGHADAEAAARAAAGRASTMRESAASSWEAETNHASKTDGGSDTPASSIARKNGGYRKASCRRTSS